MKDVKRFLVHIILLFGCADFSFAQRYLEYGIYKESDYKADTIVLNDCKYIRDVFMEDVAIYLYNAQNHPGRDNVRWANGEPIDWGYNLEPIVSTRQQDNAMEAIVSNAFTKEQVANIGDDKLQITLNISSTTGRITDVYFMFFPTDFYVQIPVEVFREIELQFKENIIFELTEEGHNMTYVYLSWEMIPKGREDSGLEVPEDGGKLTLPDGKLGDAVGSLGGSAIRP